VAMGKLSLPNASLVSAPLPFHEWSLLIFLSSVTYDILYGGWGVLISP
jgi:hypothetical protein